MSILRDISLYWSMFHVVVLFLMLFRSRYAERKTLLLAAAGMGVLMLLNIAGLILFGVEMMGKLLLLTCTLPSFLFFYLLSEDRSGCFLFTFCLVDTVCYWVLCVTNLLDHFFGGGQFVLMLITRLIAFPVMEIIIYRYFRKVYLNLQRIIKKGWGACAGMTALYYVLLVTMLEFPTRINDRPEYIPGFLLVLTLMVFNYVIIFTSLHRQYQLYERDKAERLLQEQKLSLEIQLENQQHIRKLRHDMRGHIITLQGLLQDGKEQEAAAYLESMEQGIAMPQSAVCADPYLNALLAHYVQKFRELQMELQVEVRLGSNPLPYTEVCSLVSNALENAWEASRDLPQEQRSASLRMRYSRDYLVIRLRNRCRDTLTVARGDIPPSSKDAKGHGFGLRSIREIAEKLDGDMICYTENGCFVLDVMLRPGAADLKSI